MWNSKYILRVVGAGSLLGMAWLPLACSDGDVARSSKVSRSSGNPPTQVEDIAVVHRDESVSGVSPSVDGGDGTVVASTKDRNPTQKSPTLWEMEVLTLDIELGRDYLSDGRRFLSEGKADDAVIALRHALVENPKSPDVWFTLGQAYLTSDYPIRGTLCLEEALMHDKTHVETQKVLGKFYVTQGEFEKARPLREKVARAEPDAFGSHYVLGRIYGNLKMWKEAVESFSKAMEVKPESVSSQNSLGFAALQIGENDKARKVLELAAQHQDAKAYVFNNLGIAYERLKQPANALAAYTKAAEMREGYVKAIVNRDRISGTLTDEEREEFFALRSKKIDAETETDTDTIEVATVDTTTIQTSSSSGNGTSGVQSGGGTSSATED